ncbi:MAG: FKBP-type peptidyl-prolyl cis-trans isomerase, partial [Steroidobacteraceae bacterium]
PAPAASAASGSTPARAAAPAGSAVSEQDKMLFAIGEILSASVKPFALRESEMRQVQAGFASGLRGKQSGVDIETYRPKIQALLTERVAAATEKTKAAGKAYRAKAAAAKGAITTPSGIVLNTLIAGTGDSPTAEDEVEVQYEGKLVDGTVFDSSIKRGNPATFKLNAVVPCWTEGLQHMHLGGKSTLICPPELAYGDNGRPPPIPGGSTLIFQVQLMKITKAPPPAPVPATPATPEAPASMASPASPAAPAQPAEPAQPAAAPDAAGAK